MSNSIRLFLDSPLVAGARLPLDSQQSHYLYQVMRKGIGDAIEVFNGRDGAFLATIQESSRRRVLIELGAQSCQADHLPPVTLYFAPVKRSPTENIVQKATELGVTQLQPVRTERTSAKAINETRLGVIMIESAEQCERNSVPDLAEEISFDAFLKGLSHQLIFADEEGINESLPHMLDGLEKAATVNGENIGILIGPEGGFTPRERQSLRVHEQVVSVSLGPHILRADTAAIAAITLLQAARRKVIN